MSNVENIVTANPVIDFTKIKRIPQTEESGKGSSDSHLSESSTHVVESFDPSKHWEIIKVSIGDGNRVKILDNKLRSFLCHNTDMDIVPSAFIEEDFDDDRLKKVKSQKSIFPIVSFVGYIEQLKKVTKEEIVEANNTTFEIFSQFVQMIESEFLRNSASSVQAFKAGKFTFSQLTNALAVPGKLIVYKDGDQVVCCKTKSANVKSSFFSGTFIEVTGTVTIHDGRSLIQTSNSFSVPLFRGEKTCDEVGIFEIENNPTLREKLISRGDKYIALTTLPAYRQYSGTLVRKSFWGPRHFKASGRIMIDGAGMRRVDNNYNFYFCQSRYQDNDDDSSTNSLEITEEVRICCSPYVYGFSFMSKMWGELIVDNISEIDYRSDAYEKLVLDQETKRLIFSLVDTDYRENSDLIDGKGGGCIFLLEGNPGCGKTLTAEAIAERLKRPLYMVSVGELGTDVEMLEESLRQILDTASAWNAVLLIDEADIFLEARTDLNIERNAMVGVFLRLLEYYEGILFLTTNRAGNIDQAFFSRISMAIHYEDLGATSRLKIWTTLLNNSKIPTEFAEKLYPYELNGRQIKNCIRNANALAKAEQRTVDMVDFNTVIGTAIKFDNHLQKQRKIAAKAKMSFFERIWDWIRN